MHPPPRCQVRAPRAEEEGKRAASGPQAGAAGLVVTSTATTQMSSESGS